MDLMRDIAPQESREGAKIWPFDWYERLRLYSAEKRRILDSEEEFDQETHEMLIRKYRV